MTTFVKSSCQHNYTITSPHTLICKRTGRVVATFYNDEDLSEVTKKLKKYKRMKKVDPNGLMSWKDSLWYIQ